MVQRQNIDATCQYATIYIMPSTSTDMFNSMLVPEQGDLSAEHARYVLDLHFTEAEQDRCEELSYKAQEGSLTPEERHELERFLMANSFLVVLKAKARRSLEPRPSAA